MAAGAGRRRVSKGPGPKGSSFILQLTALRLRHVSESSGGLFLECSVPGPDLRDLYSLDPRQHQRMCLFNVFPVLERWPAAFSLLHAILPSSCCSHTRTCNHTYAYTQAHTCTHKRVHTHSILPPSSHLILNCLQESDISHTFSKGPF